MYNAVSCGCCTVRGLCSGVSCPMVYLAHVKGGLCCADRHIHVPFSMDVMTGAPVEARLV